MKETTQLGPDESGTVAIERSDFEVNDNERIEIYDFQASYENQNYDLLAFYHTPRYHWGYEGDFFGLLRETTDMAGEDIWNAKAPIGGEFVGKGEMEGLKVVAGPEIYWGANPKIMAKYEWGEESKFAFVLSEDISRTEDSTDATAPTTRQERQATLYAKTSLSNDMTLEMGGIIANLDRKGDDYTYRDGSKVREDKIDNEDALGIKAKLTYDMESSRAYLGVNYSGLVANGGDPLREFGTELPYSSLGNKQEIEGGIQFISGDYQFFPRFLYRENIVDANYPAREPTTVGSTLNQGLAPRNQDDDPFAVLDNREATALEFFFTYDPTPATWFYAWDVDMIEDAPFALNIGLTATHYGSGTDAYEFFFEDTNSNVAFGEGLDEEDVWLLKSKMIFNPKRGLRGILNLEVGKEQTTGQPDEDAAEFYKMDGKLIVDQTHIYAGYVMIDAFGPYDFQQQFNIKYPLQLKLEYTMLLDQLKDQDQSSQVGIAMLYRSLDSDSPDFETEDGSDWMSEIQTYFQWKF